MRRRPTADNNNSKQRKRTQIYNLERDKIVFTMWNASRCMRDILRETESQAIIVGKRNCPESSITPIIGSIVSKPSRFNVARETIAMN